MANLLAASASLNLFNAFSANSFRAFIRIYKSYFQTSLDLLTNLFITDCFLSFAYNYDSFSSSYWMYRITYLAFTFTEFFKDSS